MSSILDKLHLVVAGKTHDLLDKAIDMNSPSALRQYVRDLESALDGLKNEAAVAAGHVTTTKREIEELNAKIEKCKSDAANYKTNGHENLARNKVVEMINFQKELATKERTLVEQSGVSTKLDQSVAALSSKHSEMVSKIHELETLDASSKASESAASALEHAGKIVDSGDGVSVDDMESRIRARSDVANEKLNRAMGTVVEPENPETTAQVDDILKNL